MGVVVITSDSWRHGVRAVSLAMTLSTLLLASGAGAGQKENVDALYRLIIQKADSTTATLGELKGQPTDYTGKKLPKALVVCMNWSDVTPTRYAGRFFVRTGSSSKPPISVDAAVALQRLRILALHFP
jgi:hypothetical protein